jgi:hypothetical protein
MLVLAEVLYEINPNCVNALGIMWSYCNSVTEVAFVCVVFIVELSVL